MATMSGMQTVVPFSYTKGLRSTDTDLVFTAQLEFNRTDPTVVCLYLFKPKLRLTFCLQPGQVTAVEYTITHGRLNERPNSVG